MQKFYPDMYQKSIYDINYKKLKKEGINCILFDLDNTCVPYKDSVASEELEKLFKKLEKMGFRVIIFSNSPDKRLRKFKYLGVSYNSFSLKPLSFSFYKILKKYNLQKSEVCIVGDQIFTDVFGGNKVGIKTCLVEPLNDTELKFTRFMRKLEKKTLNYYSKRGKFTKGDYYD